MILNIFHCCAIFYIYIDGYFVFQTTNYRKVRIIERIFLNFIKPYGRVFYSKKSPFFLRSDWFERGDW